MAKKIAILTQPLITNYGGTLQAFALQKVVRGLGYNVETINYQYIQKSKIYEILSTLKNLVLKYKRVFYFTKKERDIIRKEHDNFINKYINYSCALYNIDDLKKYFELRDFDVVIVGSDQVWREAYSPRIESFFLDFLIENNQINKIVYSASFGVDKWQFSESKTIELKKLCNSIPHISVREKSGVSLCKQYFNLDVRHTVDPTLLLSSQDYLNLIAKLDVSNKDKIFTYILDENQSSKAIVDFISCYLGKETFNSQPVKINKESFIIKDLNSYIYPSIESWLNSFYQADFIITDSFHGTVFSIIFNKPFVSIVNNKRGASRFESLLSTLGLKNRMINDISEIENIILQDKIDYDYINIKLKELREDSINFLKKSLI